jgi:ppGpp synthetase/RelA/SpoT-type nucleotidyltranferase
MISDATRVAAEQFAAQANGDILFALSESFHDIFDSERRVSVAWRIKSDESIHNKIKKGNRHFTPKGEPLINDFIGFRIVVLHIGLLERAMTAARKWAALRELRLIDMSNRFSHPGMGGYRSLHLDFEFQFPQVFGLLGVHGIELQITTYLQQFHNQLSHDALYKIDRTDEYAERAHALKIISGQLESIDQTVAELFVRK